MQREIRIELGRLWMAGDLVAGLTIGSRIELDSPAGGEVEIYVGIHRFARAEPAVMDGKLCFRVSALATPHGAYVSEGRGPDSVETIESKEPANG